MKHSQTIPRSPSVPVAAKPFVRALPLPASEWITTTIVLLVALVQGMNYLILAPPWQHYDEPTHFEYAWLVAHHAHLPRAGDQDPAMRREVAASMAEHQFFEILHTPRPPLIDDQETWIGISELGHPPLYYVLASLPLRLASHLDVTSQLYLARSVSLLLLLLTIAVAAGMMRDLAPLGHPLRWAVPLALALIPPFVDLMTAVNNDAGAIAVFSLFLWAVVRVIRFGLNWRRIAWMFGAGLLAVATKNTASIALLFAPLACLVAIWAQQGWRWRWLLASALALGTVALIAIVGWGDAAYWYRDTELVSQESDLRVQNPTAPFGPHAIMLETSAEVGARQILSPLLGQDVGKLAGRTITVGGWFWADRPAGVSAPRLAYKTPDMAVAATVDHPIQITTSPTFVAWTFSVPHKTYLLNYSLLASAPAAGEPPLKLFLDGALIVAGTFPTDTPPVFDDEAAQSGTWAGRRFTNLVRNASGEQGWPRLRPWFDRILSGYIHRSVSQLVAALLDVQRVAPLLLPYLVRPAVESFVQTFAWNNIRIADPIWLTLAGYLAVVALYGCLRWMFAPRSKAEAGLRPALLFLALVCLVVWINTIVRPLPMIGGTYVVPSARYTFPAIAITALAIVGGWWALWPHKLRLYATLGLIAGLVVLNGVAVGTIVSFYRSIPLG